MTQASNPSSPKMPFDVQVALDRVRQSVRLYPPAGLFQLADEGHNSAFEQVVACIISIRTYDETMLPVARRLFAHARTPGQVAALDQAELDGLIAPCTFHETKAAQILAIAHRAVAEFGGQLPCQRDVLLSLPGVGPKCAHLVLGIACDQPRIGVDIHVHRVTNRWGYVNASTPERTMAALEGSLPRRYWVEINRLLVPFGKHICTGALPRCSSCLVLDMCQQVGVADHR